MRLTRPSPGARYPGDHVQLYQTAKRDMSIHTNPVLPSARIQYRPLRLCISPSRFPTQFSTKTDDRTVKPGLFAQIIADRGLRDETTFAYVLAHHVHLVDPSVLIDMPPGNRRPFPGGEFLDKFSRIWRFPGGRPPIGLTSPGRQFRLRAAPLG